MPDVPETNSDDRADSAAKLGLTKYLPAIDAVQAQEGPVSGDPGDPNAISNEQALAQTATRQPVLNTTVAPAPAKDASWLDAIPDAIDSKSWLDDVPDSKTPVQKTYDLASTTDADRNAKVLNLSQQSGQDPAYVDTNLKQVEAASNKVSPELFDKMERDYPGSMKFYSKADNMAVAHDDIPNVVQHEQLVQGVTQAHTLLDAFKAGYQDSVLGRTIRGKAPDSTLPTDAPETQRLAYQAGSFVNPLDLGIMGVGATIGSGVGAAAGSLVAPVAGTIAGGIAGGGAGGFGLLAFIKSAITEQQKNGDPKSIQEGLDRVYAIGKETAKQMGVGALTSIAGEAAAPLGIAAKLAAEVGTMTVAPKAIDDQEVEGRDLGEGLLMVGGLHAAGAGAELALGQKQIADQIPKTVQAEKTQSAKDFYSSLGDTVEASKLRERVPGAHLQLVSDLTKNTPVENVYLPVDAATSYFQGKGMKIDDVAGQMGIQNELAEARATGSDIKIPLSRWVDTFAGTEHYKGLENDIKFHPEDLTTNETTTMQAETAAQVQAAAGQAADDNPVPAGADHAQALESAGRIYQDVQQKLKDAGLSANEVRFDPKLHEAFFSTIAKRINDSLPADSQIDPYELQQKFPLEVRRFDSLEQRAEQTSPQGPDASSPEGQAQLKEASQQAKQDRLAMARKALEAIPDLHKDDAAEALGLSKQQVRGMRGVSERMGRGSYSREEIRAAAGMQENLAGGSKSFDQGKATPIETELQTSHPIPDSVHSPEIKPDESLAGLAPKELRAQAFEYAKNKESRGTVKNEHTGWDINVTGEGLKKSANLSTRPEQTLALKNLDELIKSATLLRSAPDRAGREGIDSFHYLYSPFESDGKSFIAKIAVKEGAGQGGEPANTFYSLHVQEMKEPADGQSNYISEGQAGPSVGERTLNKADLFSRVNEARETSPLFQGEEDAPRGQLLFKGRQFNIDLFKDADKSTFLHETGHFFLEALGHVVEGEGEGSAPLQKDYASILKFLGVHSRDEIGPEQHEKFARAFEEYLSTGEAPSAGLRESFVRFRKWLTDLWKKVSFSNVEVSPEIRGVFDRMLAADNEIKDARKSLNMEDEFGPEGLDEATSQKIKDLQDKARSRAEETLLKDKLAETKQDYKDKLAEERTKFRSAAEEQVGQEPVYQAVDALREPGVNPYNLVEASLRGELTHEQSVKFETVAQEHGFDSAEDMAKQISDAHASGDFENKVGAMVTEGLRQIGMIKDHDQLREEAIRAIHSENMTELLALEREALADLANKADVSGEVRRRNRIVAKVEAAAANAEARRILESKPASEAGKPQTYITQERNAAAKVARYIARKDFEKAAEAKKQQMVAHALVRESFKISEEAAKHNKYLAQFVNRGGNMLEMPYGFVRQVDQMLSKFGYQADRVEDTKTLTAVATKMAAEGSSPEDIANATGYALDSKGAFVPETLQGFVDRVNDNYYSMDVPPEISGAGRREKDDLTIGELSSLRETVQAVANTGRKYNRFLSEFIKVDMKEAAAKLKTSIEENFGTKYAEDMLPGNKDQSKAAEMLQSLSRLPDALDRTLDTVLTTCQKFDGLESDKGRLIPNEGPAKEFIYRPFAEAQARKIVRTRQAMEEMEGIFAKNYKEDEFAKYKDTSVIVDGRKFTKENILAAALNWGNEGNRDRLLRGFAWTEATAREAFSHLGANDWQFAQDTWDHIDKYWPEISKLEMDVNGVEPGKVQAKKFSNEHGEFAGGYYPISYDFEKSADAFMNNQSKDALFKQYSAAKAATANGHAQARVTQVTRSLRLSLDVLANHHEDVIHDLEFRKPVIDANRFLNQKDVKTGIVNAVGIKGYAGFQDWLKSVAGGNSEPMSFWDQAAQWFRFKTTFFNLGYRIVSAPKIAVENLVNASSELGVTGAVRALKNYYLGDSGQHDYVIGKSEFMKQRAEHLNRDFSDITDKYQGKTGVISSFRDYAFFVHAYLDQGVSFPVWADTFRRGMAEHGDEDLATSQADESVKRTFMSGGSVDQPAAMRGNDVKKALTTAYGYQSMMWNRFSQAKFAAGAALADGNPLAATAIAARASVYTFLMPALVTALTRELLRNNQVQSNDQDRKKRMAASMIEEATPLKFIPIVRDLQSHFVRKAFGEHTSDLQVTPLEEAAQNLIDPMAELIGGKRDGKMGEKLTNDLSMMVGFPKQFNDIAFNFIDAQKSHGSVSWKDAMSRRTKK